MDKQTENRYYKKKIAYVDGISLMVGTLDITNPLIKKALIVATTAHLGRLDKGGHPFICHPISIAEKLTDTNEIVTALLHDVVEDTPLTLNDLRNDGFPEEVIVSLDLLNHRKNDSYFDYYHKLQTNPLAYAVKLVDLEMNLDLNRLNWVRSKDAEREIRYEAALKGFDEKKYSSSFAYAEERNLLFKEGKILASYDLKKINNDDLAKVLSSIFSLLDEGASSQKIWPLPCSILASFYLGQTSRNLEEARCFDSKVSNVLLYYFSVNKKSFEEAFSSGLLLALLESLSRGLLYI
jgi:hypothetical protein